MISATHKTEWQSRDRKKPVESAFTCYTNKRSRRLALVPLHARNEKHQGVASLAQVAICFSTALEPLNFFMARRDLNNRGKVLHWFGGLVRGGLGSVITPRLKPGVAEADAVIGEGVIDIVPIVPLLSSMSNSTDPHGIRYLELMVKKANTSCLYASRGTGVLMTGGISMGSWSRTRPENV
jgi:hypothetical protein